MEHQNKIITVSDTSTPKTDKFLMYYCYQEKVFSRTDSKNDNNNNKHIDEYVTIRTFLENLSNEQVKENRGMVIIFTQIGNNKSLKSYPCYSGNIFKMEIRV